MTTNTHTRYIFVRHRKLRGATVYFSRDGWTTDAQAVTFFEKNTRPPAGYDWTDGAFQEVA